MPPLSRIYTVPMLVGSNKQNLSVQVDTGSSDLVRSVFLLFSELILESNGIFFVFLFVVIAVVVAVLVLNLGL